jgi:hypothetical protein
MSVAGASRRSIVVNLGGSTGWISHINQVNLAVHNRPQNFTNSEAYPGQFVLSAMSGH